MKLGGGKLDKSGSYAVDLVWANKKPLSLALRQVPLRARVLARQRLGSADGALVLCAALGALLSVFSAFVPEAEAPRPKRQTAIWAVIGTLLAVALAAIVLRLPIPGSIGGLTRGLGLALVEVGVAVGCAFYLIRLRARVLACTPRSAAPEPGCSWRWPAPWP